MSDKINNKLYEIYYNPVNLWRGKSAINKLSAATKYDKNKVKNWLEQQEFYQIHYPPPKHIIHPHYQVDQTNKLHQFDILYMPRDNVYGTTYKYILTGIDAASRYKVARPMKNKTATTTLELLKDIYKYEKNIASGFIMPETFQCDNGSEFKGVVYKWLIDNNIKVRAEVTKYHHSHTAFAESFNKQLASKLFAIQDVNEIKQQKLSGNTVDREWVKYLYKIVDHMNNSVTNMINMKPVNAIKLKTVEQFNDNKNDTKSLDTNIMYRYLLSPGEEHNDTKRRETDNYWSRKKYWIDEIIKPKSGRYLYKLDDDKLHERSFVAEELMPIPNI